MTDLTVADATAAPVRLKFKGKNLTFRPLGQDDWGELERNMMAHEYQQGMALLAQMNGEFTDEEKVKLRHQVMADAKAQRLGTPHFIRYCSTIPGITFIAWLQLRRDHPDLTLDVVADLMMSRGFQDVVDAADKLLDGSAGRSGSVAGKPRTRSRSKTRKRKKKKNSR